MKVLIIAHVRQFLLQELIEKLEKYKYKINVNYFLFSENKSWSMNPIYKVMVWSFWLTKLLLSPKSEIIHIHYLSRASIYLLPLYKLKAKRIVVTIWGSDFINYQNIYNKYQKRIKKYVSRISFTSESFEAAFKSRIDFPCTTITRFGLSILDEIRKLSQHEINSFRTKYNIPQHQKIIVCGTNASPNQQHYKIIDAIKKSPNNLNKDYVFIFPLTYGNDTEQVSNYLTKTNLNYIIFNKTMSNHELACLRWITDILINVQINDQLSGAMIETMYAGAVIIKGDWLSYPILEEQGLKFINISNIDDLHQGIALSEKAQHDIDFKERKLVIDKLMNWEQIILQWEKLYDNASSTY